MRLVPLAFSVLLATTAASTALASKVSEADVRDHVADGAGAAVDGAVDHLRPAATAGAAATPRCPGCW